VYVRRFILNFSSFKLLQESAIPSFSHLIFPSISNSPLRKSKAITLLRKQIANNHVAVRVSLQSFLHLYPRGRRDRQAGPPSHISLTNSIIDITTVEMGMEGTIMEEIQPITHNHHHTTMDRRWDEIASEVSLMSEFRPITLI
jgi:hypothetical protein